MTSLSGIKSAGVVQFLWSSIGTCIKKKDNGIGESFAKRFRRKSVCRGGGGGGGKKLGVVFSHVKKRLTKILFFIKKIFFI